MKALKSIAAIIYQSAIVFPLIFIGACHGAKKPQDYGVSVAWKYGGATSSYPWIEVWASDSKGRIDSPMIFGGIEDPQLSYSDIDGDGILDIIFGNKAKKQILAYKPEIRAFVILRNDMEGREY